MTDEEVNKIIAEFMGYRPYLPHNEVRKAWKDKNTRVWESFTESLDALVPAIKKLTEESGAEYWLNINRHGVEDYHLAFFRQNESDIHYANSGDVTIQQVAAHSVAKAIKALLLKDKK